MKNVLVVGTGEVGKAVIELLEESKKFKVFRKDVAPIQLKEKIDVMHVCIPFSEGFEKIVEGYIKEFKPGLTIIDSTVRPGTTEKIEKKTGKLVVHSPVRGKHPHLKAGLLKFVKFVGSTSRKAAEDAAKHFEEAGVKTEILSGPGETEVGKLLCTTYYGANIAFHQEMARICEHYGVNFGETVTRFSATGTIDINHKIPRPLMFPGTIGGHCVMPNIDILQKEVNSSFLSEIVKSNDKTKKKPFNFGLEEMKKYSGK